MRPAAARVEHEEDRDERQRIEEVALLHAVAPARRVEGAFEQEPEGEEERERGERQLGARDGAPEREHETEERAGHEHPSRRVRENERLRTEPGEQRVDAEPEIEDAVVVAEHAPGPGREPAEEDGAEETEHEHLLAQCAAQAALAQSDERERGDEGEREDDELDASERGKARQDDERDLRAAGRPC